MHVTMTIRGARWPSVCSFSGSFPLFSPLLKNPKLSPTHPPLFIFSTCAPTSPSHLQCSPQLHPVYASTHHSKTPPCFKMSLSLQLSLSHLGERSHPSVWAQQLTHIQPHLRNCKVLNFHLKNFFICSIFFYCLLFLVKVWKHCGIA